MYQLFIIQVLVVVVLHALQYAVLMCCCRRHGFTRRLSALVTPKTASSRGRPDKHFFSHPPACTLDPSPARGSRRASRQPRRAQISSYGTASGSPTCAALGSCGTTWGRACCATGAAQRPPAEARRPSRGGSACCAPPSTRARRRSPEARSGT